jgi:hypothetical protein
MQTDSNENELVVEEPKAVFLTPAKFDKIVEDLVWELDCTHLEAIVEYCSRNDIDIEDSIKFISKPMKEKLEYDGIANGLLKKTAQLPF